MGSNVLAACATAAGITSEVPPVAVAFVAATPTIAVAWAATKLFDFLTDTIFNLTPIPRSMPLPMATKMAAQMATPTGR